MINPTEGKLTEADSEMDCLPCVFCGGNEVIMVDRVKGLYSFSIRCDNMQCVAEGPQAHTRKDAVKAWNTRPESLKAPAVTTGEATIREIIKALEKLPIEQAEVISGDHKGWEFKAVDWHEIRNVIFVIKRDYLSAPAPLSSEAVEARDILSSININHEGHVNGVKTAKTHWCPACRIQRALALLTQAPSETENCRTRFGKLSSPGR